jgi:hypothetical protein
MINLKQKHHSYIFWGLVVLSIVFLLSVTVFIFYRWVHSLEPSDVYNNEVVRKQIKKRVGKKNEFFVELAPEFLGFKKPKTYLVLFLNNTELRPGGGFIGSYATVKVEEGKIKVLKIEGSGQLDKRSPEDWQPRPPKIIKDYLKVDQWFFRDSNWSPDFAKSSRKTLKFYTKEGGVAGKRIDHVVGVTTDVLARLLEVIGPVKVENHTFSSKNVVRKLQYEVHYGFKDRGLSFSNRKQILRPFFKKVVSNIQSGLIQDYQNYLHLVRDLLQEKHIVVYSEDDDVQKKMEQKNYAGRVDKDWSKDFLMWVDANLAALKTDHAIKRKIDYQIKSSDEYGYVGLVKMTYEHTGTFDWRTSHYRSFARAYLPKNSSFISASKSGNKIKKKEEVKSGIELDKKWFGHVIRVAPGKTKSLTYKYDLAPKVDKLIKQGNYQLKAQKQIGTDQTELTLNLDFGKKLTGADPSEDKENWGDNSYNYQTKLKVDKKFNIKL